MSEIWKDIEEFKDSYEVSNFGRVRSKERFKYTRTYPSKIMKPLIGNNGCVLVRLRNGKSQVRRSVAKLVLLAFVGNPPDVARQVRHKDGNPNNNYVDNLEWDVCKAYTMPVNIHARELFNSKAEKMIDIYIEIKRVAKALNFVYFDVDDFKQLCLYKIWRYIDAYTEDINFFTFCARKCDDIFRKVYAKEIDKFNATIRYEDMVTEESPVDFIAELGYTEDFEKCDLLKMTSLP